MNNTKKKKHLKFGSISIEMYDNGFPKGFVLKREPTTREAMFILQKIMGFANDDYKDWFDLDIERKGYLDQCRYILTEFLKGECDYDCLCNETQCYDDDGEGFSMPIAFTLASYLQKKGII